MGGCGYEDRCREVYSHLQRLGIAVPEETRNLGLQQQLLVWWDGHLSKEIRPSI